MTKYEIINDNLTSITGYQLGEHVTLDNIVNAVVDYAYNHNGVNGDTFVFDRYLWNKLELNHQMPLTINTVWRYVSKYVEELPANYS